MDQSRIDECIRLCNECADACDRCAAACLNEPNVEEMARCIVLDIDCAAICRLSAAFMARDSEFATALCRVCGDVCRSCGEECARHEAAHCRRCADICRRCAEACNAMAA